MMNDVVAGVVLLQPQCVRERERESVALRCVCVFKSTGPNDNLSVAPGSRPDGDPPAEARPPPETAA